MAQTRRLAFIPVLAILAVPAAAAAALPQPAASVIARIGDPAPGVARVRGPWSGRIALTATGGRLFSDTSYSALYLSDSGVTRVLLHVGDPVPGRGTLATVSEVAAGGGAIAALIGETEGSTGGAIVRVAPGGGVESVEIAAGDTLALRSGPATITNILGVSVDGAGRIIAAVLSAGGPSAIVRRVPGGSTEVLLQTGDPIGMSTFVDPLTAPAANASGEIVFDATTAAATHVLARRSGGGALVTLFEAPVPPCPPPGFCPAAPLGVAPPAINDAGDVAFLWSSGGTIRAQRVSGGMSETVAEPGSPAPIDGTFTDITDLPPAIDVSGAVVFGAQRSSGVGGVYRTGSQTDVVAEEGSDAGGGRQFAFFYIGRGQAAPVVAADGTVSLAAVDTEGDAIFARSGTLIQAVTRAGEPIAGVARFVNFFESFFPSLGAGPSMAPNADVIFDARITGGRRGLFARRPGVGVRPIALDGDAAPGGGQFDGEFLSFSSINADGVVAFLGATTGTGTGSSLSLYLGPGAGPLNRIFGVGDPVPGFAALLSGFLPPSGINARGALALPVALTDGKVVLLGWDGVALRRVAAPGDVIPGAGAITQIRNQPLLPPVLDDAGNILFTATTVAGGAGLYEAPLIESGYGSAHRVIGAGDLVEGGVLDPFRLRMMARDAAGRLALQVAPAPGARYATYDRTEAVPALVVAPGASLPGVGTVADVRPHLAAAGDEGIVHEIVTAFSQYWLLLAVPPSAQDPGAGFAQVALVGPGLPSPDGGVYLDWAEGGFGGGLPPVTDRLASNGGRYAAMLTRTTAGPQTLVLFDLRPNLPPGADAGPGQTLECASHAGTKVTLDGTASADPEQGGLEYQWTGPFGTATGPQPVVTIPLGTWVITLTVRDPEGVAATDTVTITVRDTVAPVIIAHALPATLWPPDGNLRDVAYRVLFRDLCDPAPQVVLASIAIDDPKGADPATDIVGADYGTFDRAVMLRARRGGGGNGRTYTATYRATDASGNFTEVAARVVVPQSLGK